MADSNKMKKIYKGLQAGATSSESPDYAGNVRQSFNSLKQAIGADRVNDFNKPMGSDEISQRPASHPESVAYPDDVERHEMIKQKLGITPESMAEFKAKMDAMKQQQAMEQQPPENPWPQEQEPQEAIQKDEPSDEQRKKQALAQLIKQRTQGY